MRMTFSAAPPWAGPDSAATAAVSAAKGPTLLAFLCLFGGALLAFFLTLYDNEWYWTFHGGWDSRNPHATYDELRATLY